MGIRLSDDEARLYQRVDEVLHYLWDPCGVSDAPEARDEYYAYLPDVFRLLQGGAGEEALAEHLTTIEAVDIGVPIQRRRAQDVAAILAGYRALILGEN
jgi:hypothetical protein